MKKSLKQITLQDLAALVSTHLKKHSVDAVLTGGACVSIFSSNTYQSLDLDFVSSAVEDNPREIRAAMAEIGFKRMSEGFFENSSCPFIVEFIPPPLAIGREPVNEIKTKRTPFGSFRLLSPTDCVKDRLAAFYFWDDLQSLEQAKMVARKQKINFREVKRWSKIEGQLKKYHIFVKQLYQ